MDFDVCLCLLLRHSLSAFASIFLCIWNVRWNEREISEESTAEEIMLNENENEELLVSIDFFDCHSDIFFPL